MLGAGGDFVLPLFCSFLFHFCAVLACRGGGHQTAFLGVPGFNFLACMGACICGDVIGTYFVGPSIDPLVRLPCFACGGADGLCGFKAPPSFISLFLVSVLGRLSLHVTDLHPWRVMR